MEKIKKIHYLNYVRKRIGWLCSILRAIVPNLLLLLFGQTAKQFQLMDGNNVLLLNHKRSKERCSSEIDITISLSGMVVKSQYHYYVGKWIHVLNRIYFVYLQLCLFYYNYKVLFHHTLYFTVYSMHKYRNLAKENLMMILKCSLCKIS